MDRADLLVVAAAVVEAELVGTAVGWKAVAEVESQRSQVAAGTAVSLVESSRRAAAVVEGMQASRGYHSRLLGRTVPQGWGASVVEHSAEVQEQAEPLVGAV